MPLWLPAAIGAVGQIGSNLLNNAAQNRIYEKQRRDNIEFWNMQNEYNTPAAQMQRFKDAGLNTKLIYGQGASGGGNAGAISAPSKPQIDYSGIPNSIASYFDIQQKMAQTDLLKQQKEVQVQEELNKALNRDDKYFDLWQKKRMADWSFDYLKEQVRKIAMERDVLAANNPVITENKDDIPAGTTMSKVEEIKAKRIQNALNYAESELRKHGLSFRDPVWQRALMIAVKHPNRVRELIENLLNKNY